MYAVKTAVIGASGFIGRHLWAKLKKIFPDALGTSFSSSRPDLTRFDIRHPDISALRLNEHGYKAAIICAAKSNVGYCETNPEESFAVNVRGTLELVRQLGKASIQTIFLSTDYVFDGSTGGYADDSPTAPHTEYGRQKAIVEQAIPKLTDNFLILRIGKIYGIDKGDKTLLDDIASSLASSKVTQCARDQLFCPTFVDDLIDSILELQSKKITGLFNLCSAESWSRHQIAVALANKMQVDSGLVNEISLHDLPSMQRRPLNTTLECNSPVVRSLQRHFKATSASIEIVASNYRNVTSS